VKPCSKCGVVRPLDDYYLSKSGADGLMSQCKPCTRERARAHRAAHPEQAANRFRPADAGSQQRYRQRHAEAIKGRQRRWYAANREKRAAQNQVYRAVSRGDLVRPATCGRCGAGNCLIEASHNDYSRPLEVEWLCSSCHRRKDRRVEAFIAKQGTAA